MSVILTSFKKSINLPKSYEYYSVSRFQPKSFIYNDLECLSAMDKDGNKLSLRELGITGYKHKLFEYYVSEWDKIFKWLNDLDNNKHIVLCCWCPYSNSTKKQIEKYGIFVCHTGLIGKLINKYRTDIDIYLDNDRELYLYNEYKPQKYKKLNG